MSRHAFFCREDYQTIWMGWDPPMATYFLHLLEGDDEPTLWEGTRYAQYPEPEPLIALARTYSDDIPLDLAARLRADRQLEPAWDMDDVGAAPRELGTGEGERREAPAASPSRVSRLWKRIAGR